jgi:hypothetical protein
VRRLFRRVNAGEDKTLLLKVAHTLNYYPAARDSDITLSIKLLHTFYPSYIQPDDTIRLENLYKIPKFYDMQRLRAKLQNSYGLFLASPEVAAFRKKRQFKQAEEFAESVPDFSPMFVFADESGKTDKHLIIGSIWLYSADQYHQAIKSLTDWRKTSGHKNEFHFKRLRTNEEADAAAQFFDLVISSNPFHGFKALIARNDQIPANRRLDSIYDAFAEMLIDGIKSEISTRRVSPPLTLHLTKDADPSADLFRVRDLNRKLVAAIRVEFRDGLVTLDANKINCTPSEANDLVQISDLFTGSINRWLNHGVRDPVNNPKDKLATHVGSQFSWRIDDNGKLLPEGDACNIIYLDN